ncbi:B-4DMT family transporter [Nocardia sp. 348MFTsu5.1]|uniref:B-4DMT family transporter n=1 Tax=Nocardia sp. 348MFTsu5.1 TaxID=1172185 RepID=UPI00037816C0|nr:B-4DMT family transporter [Nocardia sp. 348MFTsu5.1]
MVAWLLRGLVMSAVHIGARVLLGLAIVAWPLETNYWKTIAIAGVVLVALIWGGIDGLIDGRAHPDPDDYDDLTMRWLKAGLLTGLISAVVCWVLGNWVMSGIGENSLAIEIFAGGSFTTLLVFVPALVGAAVGRLLTRRQHRKNEAKQDDNYYREDARTAS